MEQLQLYILLFGIILLVGQIFNKSTIPLSLILVIIGMLLSVVPNFPQIDLNPDVVLNVFLPIMAYQISSFSSWPEIKRNRRAIGLLSVGHVIFITFLVALVIHALLPELGWPLAFVLGAVISPPDDVAIVSIAKKIRMPSRIVTILEGEGMLNDATALILFRFALAAVATHQFSAVQAMTDFLLVVVCESLYGFVLGMVIGELRLRIKNNSLHTIASVLTPFIAYIPAEMLGGSGILATVVTGFVIGHRYSIKFSSDFRLFSYAFWPTLSFALESVVFLLVGLDLYSILQRISSIPMQDLILFSGSIIATVIIGRFVWIFGAVEYLPRWLFPAIRKKDPPPPWQHAFLSSWAGMRGGISLAAALAVPSLPAIVDGVNPRDLLVFLVFSVIVVTFLLQGLTLPWILNILGIKKAGEREEYEERMIELSVRLKMTDAVLRWLAEYKKLVQGNAELLDETDLYVREYRMFRMQLKKRMHNLNLLPVRDLKKEVVEEGFLLSRIIDIERTELLRLWAEEKISLTVRNKLLKRLDHGAMNIAE